MMGMHVPGPAAALNVVGSQKSRMRMWSTGAGFFGESELADMRAAKPRPMKNAKPSNGSTILLRIIPSFIWAFGGSNWRESTAELVAGQLQRRMVRRRMV